jgi:uncharacterized protein (TIGR02646 family)
MIRVHPVPPAPEALAGDDSPAARERQKAAAYWAEKGTMKGFRFQVYKDERVVAALEAAFFGKCAYCEFAYAGGAPPDVEHYRPKGAIEVDGALTEPGYYWLASEWTNLLPSCVDCNRARYQAFADEDPELSGKANKFPIGDPAKRARRPGDEAHEERLLLHPYFDDPREHLRFLDRGAIQAALTDAGTASRMGMASIETYGLDRKRLTDARDDVWVRVSGYVSAMRQFVEWYDADPGNPYLEVMVATHIGYIKGALGERQPFLGMVRQLVEPVEEMLR